MYLSKVPNMLYNFKTTKTVMKSKMIRNKEVNKMSDIPLIDWNGNGRIDYSDVATSLAMGMGDNDDEDE